MKPYFVIRLNGRLFSRSSYVGRHKAKLADLRHLYPLGEVSTQRKGNKLTVNLKTM